MLTVAIWNLKGGTCKSSTTLNLGAALATAKRKTVLVDLDGQRTLSFGLGMDGRQPTVLQWLTGAELIAHHTSRVKHLSLIPGDIGMFRLTTDQDLFTTSLNCLVSFDLCLMDCPPSLGVVSVQAILASDRVLVPTLCEPAALKGLSEAIGLIRNERPEVPVEVLRVRYRPRLVLTQEADALLRGSAQELGYRLLETTIPENVTVAEAIAQQCPVGDYAPRSMGAVAFRSLAKECLQGWGLK